MIVPYTKQSIQQPFLEKQPFFKTNRKETLFRVESELGGKKGGGKKKGITRS